MNKRGEGEFDTRTILWLFYIVLVVIITVFLFRYINDVASGKGFNERYLVTDVGMTFDLISSANHDLSVKYKNLEDYNLIISDGNVKIKNDDSDYDYASDQDLDISYGEFNLENQNLLITKMDKAVSINLEKSEDG